MMMTSCNAKQVDLVQNIFESDHAKKSKILSAAAAHWVKMAGKEIEDGNNSEFWIGNQNEAMVQKIAGAVVKDTEQREKLVRTSFLLFISRAHRKMF
jgi:Tfp pilus assembly protein PilV